MNPSCKNQKYKIKALEELINSSENVVPFMVLTETHLKAYIHEAEVTINNYNIYRADRILRKNGGVAVYMHEDLAVNQTEVYSDSKCEAIMLKNNDLNFILVGVYKPPTAENLCKSFKKCLDKIDSFINLYNDNSTIIILGDFNLPIIDWSTDNITNARSRDDRNCAEVLLSFMDTHLLTQLVTEATRANKNTLDLVLTNNEEWIHDIKVEKTNMSDHDFVNLDLENIFQKGPKKLESHRFDNPFDELNFHKADWPKIRDEVGQIDWESVMSSTTEVKSMIELLNSEIIKIASKHCPKRKCTNSQCSNKIPRDRRALIRRRKRLKSKINYLKYIKKGKNKKKIDNLITEKNDIEIKIKESIQREAAQKEADMISKIKTNPKILYSYAKRNSKSKSKIGPLRDAAGKLHLDATKVSNLLQDQYLKVFSDPLEKTSPNISSCSENIPIFEDIEFSETDIIDAIKLIPLNSAGGPDKFPAVILKECAEQLAKPLYIIYRLSLDTGQIPDILLQQTVVPIFKKGSRSVPENYRPVSLTSHIIKVLERILRTKLVEHLETNNFLSSHQHGFRTGKSCLTQLLQHFELILDIMESDSNADVLYLDFAKAFDKVDHKILLEKLKSIGISGKIHSWLTSFLTNRKQFVVVDGKKSRGEKVQSGVPQGTVLGPVLFIVYINDITQVIKNSYIKIFADDSKLVKSIKSMSDRDLLSIDLKSVIQWASDNKMQLNKLKFQLLQHGNKNDLKQPYKVDDNTTIEKSSDVKDLGVTVSENLSFDTHINNISKGAKRHAGWVLRIIRARDVDTMLLLYKTYVRPQLEYSSPLWSPQSVKHITKLEATQRTFTFRINGMDQFNYWDRLKILGLMSLQRRRERYQIIHIWKIAVGLIPNDLDLKFYDTARHGKKCKRPQFNQRCRRISSLKYNSFTSNGPALFNVIPKKIKEAKSLNSFKANLHKFLKSFPDNPPTPNYIGQNKNSVVEWATGSRDRSSTWEDAAATPQEEEHSRDLSAHL